MTALTAARVRDEPVAILDRVRRMIQANPSVLPTIASVVIFVGMVVYGEVAYGRILQASTLSNLLINNAHLIVLAVALTFVILTGGIDLSVGSIIAFSSVAGVMLANAGWNRDRGDGRDGRHRSALRRGLRRADQVLQRAAVHRDAGDDVPRTRLRVAAEHEAGTARRGLPDPLDRRAAQDRRRAEGERPRDHAGRDHRRHRGRSRRSSCCTAPVPDARCTRSADPRARPC